MTTRFRRKRSSQPPHEALDAGVFFRSRGHPPGPCQMAMAFRPLASSTSMKSRNGSQSLADGVESGARVSSAGPFSCPGSVDPSMAGLAWARPNLLGVGRECQQPLMGRGSFAPSVYRSFNPSQRPARPAQREDLQLLFFAQDIQCRRVSPPSRQCPGSAIPLAALQMSTDSRFVFPPRASPRAELPRVHLKTLFEICLRADTHAV
jgi:hypothetical protein